MEKKGRFDFKIESVSETGGEGGLRIKIIPDPRRYSQLVDEGKIFYLDKYLKVLIPMDQMQNEMARLPIYSLSPTVRSISEYAVRREAEVTGELHGEDPSLPPEEAEQHRDLSGDEEKCLTFVSVDICGSSAYSVVDPQGFEKALSLLIREVGTLVGQFHGRVLKLTGDGLIAYIDHPSFTSQCDATVDLGLSILVLVRDAINPSLDSVGIRPISVRVGADYGEAKVRSILIKTTGFRSQEVASDALNRAVKIEQSCNPGEFRIGRNLYELVHVG